jgi:hypothetical protein
MGSSASIYLCSQCNCNHKYYKSNKRNSCMRRKKIKLRCQFPLCINCNTYHNQNAYNYQYCKIKPNRIELCKGCNNYHTPDDGIYCQNCTKCHLPSDFIKCERCYYCNGAFHLNDAKCVNETCTFCQSKHDKKDYCFQYQQCIAEFSFMIHTPLNSISEHSISSKDIESTYEIKKIFTRTRSENFAKNKIKNVNRINYMDRSTSHYYKK